MVAVALLLGAGCSDGEPAAPGPTSTQPAPPAPTSTVPPSTVPTTTAPASTRPSTTRPGSTVTTARPEVTVRGVVAQTLASARVVVLAPPAGGFTNVAFTADTEVVRANGARAAITDIGPGATIEATGRPSTPDTLLARRVVVL